MELELLTQKFSVCQVKEFTEDVLRSEFCFIGQTDHERSLVCPTECVPKQTTVREDGWRAFRVAGTLDFSLIGILSGLSFVLAEEHIGIFVISTYDTDYILVKETQLEQSISALSGHGYTIRTLSGQNQNEEIECNL